MQILVTDERGESPVTTELNNIVNEKLTIVIGKSGGIAFIGDAVAPAIDWTKGWKHPQPFGPVIVQDCNE